MKTRQQALLDLLYYRHSVEESARALKEYSWDSEKTLAVLTHEHIANMLALYLDNKISAEELEAWANAVEGREDIGFESSSEDALIEIIHQLANPLLTFPITRGNIQRLLELL